MIWHKTGNLVANVVPPCRSESHVGHVTINFTFTGVIGSCRQPLWWGGGGESTQQTFLRGGSSWRPLPFYIVEPPLTATSLQRPLFLVDSPYIDSCLNLYKTATFFCSQGGRCGEVQLYTIFD